MSFLNADGTEAFSVQKMQKSNLFETRQMFCDIYCLEPGQAQKVHTHTEATKFYYLIEGEAWVTIGEATEKLTRGKLAFARPGEAHGVENRSASRARLLVAMAPNPNVA